MKLSTLVARNLFFYKRTNAAVILGVATAIAVLSGALLVGDSVRASLRDLVLQRLGKTEGVVTSAQFFREALANDVAGSAPLIALQGVVTHEKDGRRASNVAVYGVDDRFWKFHGVASHEGVEISAALARELGAASGDAVLLRVEKPSAIPIESLQSHKDDTGKTIRLTLGDVLDAKQLGEFSLRPTQGDVLAMFVPLRRLQRDLAQQSRVNTLLLASREFPKDKVTLNDLGIKVRVVEGGKALQVEPSSMMISDALMTKVHEVAGPHMEPVFTYVANAIRDGNREIPYSVVSTFTTDVPQDHTIQLNEWAAKDLNAKNGDEITLDYYFWEPSGTLTTRSGKFKLDAILPMTGRAIDQDLTPEYPGITEATTISSWDPPFPVDLKKVRPKDEEYWKQYRTAPKAFIDIGDAVSMWGSRFGRATSIRILDANDADAFAKRLRAAIDPAQLGMAFVTPRDQALAAAQGSTDFGEYFTYFSFFLVVSALLLAGLFFQLGIEQRLREIGTLRAMGFAAARIRRLFVAEGLLLSIIGAVIGSAAAVAYAAFLIYGLKTWWRGAVGTGLLTLHVSAQALGMGAVGGVIVAWLCVIATLRSLRHSSARDLLSGSRVYSEPKRASRLLRIVAAVSAIGGIAMIAAAFAHKIDDSAGFFGAGSLLLIAAISFEWARLRSQSGSVDSVARLGFRNTSYRPGRSVLSIALIASAVFLVIALDAFRRPAVAVTDPKSGAGGFPMIAESQLPLIWGPNSAEGRQNLNMANITDAKFYSFRLRPGEDASCLNLYEPRTPRVLGASSEFMKLGRFSFVDSTQSLWEMIAGSAVDGVIPAIADANSITYVLHKKIGDVIDVNGAKLNLVAALDDSIFQSELIISEENFKRAFPSEQGYRVFLIDGPTSNGPKLEEALSDYGFDVTSTADRLAAYHRVENTYLSTFQTLGGLGLLLGTLGLAAVLLRNVVERRKELAVLRAVGYRPEDLSRMVIAENASLLLHGIVIGAVCAFIAIAPAFFARGGHLPNPSLALLLLAVPAAGMAASLAAVRAISKAPLLETLRAE